MNQSSAAIDRLMAGITKDDETGCWVWSHAMTTPGYGRIRSHGVQWLAHRFAYTEMVGPIPTGFVIDHLCRTRACVNPTHMEPVTNAENTRRGLRGALVTACKHGHPYTPENTRISRGRRACRSCDRVRWSKQRRTKAGAAT